MPTYEYRCDNCAKNFDVVQSFHDDPLTECPTCGEPVKKVFGSVGIVFKGSGFYKTDSRSGGTSTKTAESTVPAARVGRGLGLLVRRGRRRLRHVDRHTGVDVVERVRVVVGVRVRAGHRVRVRFGRGPGGQGRRRREGPQGIQGVERHLDLTDRRVRVAGHRVSGRIPPLSAVPRPPRVVL